MIVTGGDTNVTTYFSLRLAADGTAATGLTITGFDLQYVRSGAAPSAKVDATALAATNSAHGDNQAIEIDATDAPGLYRVDWPDAAFAAGVREVILTVKVATCFTEHLRVQIDPFGAPAGASLSADIATIDTNVDAILVDTGTTLQAEVDAIQAAVITNAAGADIAADIIAIKAETANILTDTGTTLDGKINTIDTNVDAILVDTGTTLQAELDGIQADTEDIQSRLPAALTGGGNIKADMLAISGDTTAADNLEEGATALVLTSVNDAAATTTSFVTALTEVTDDHYNGRIITFTSGALAGQSTDITDYTGSTKTVTVTALTEAPANSVTFVIS